MTDVFVGQPQAKNSLLDHVCDPRVRAKKKDEGGDATVDR
jgi:hypothetical protein